LRTILSSKFLGNPCWCIRIKTCGCCRRDGIILRRDDGDLLQLQQQHLRGHLSEQDRQW
jgi:hypothetical protein